MFVDLISIGETYSRLFNGDLVVVDYPLSDWLAIMNRGTRCGTYPELVGLSF